MKINDKILSLPPYISTAWSNISTIRLQDNQVLITLQDGSTVQVPALPAETVEMIFKTHAEVMERKEKNFVVPRLPQGSIQFGFGTPDGMSMLQHDPSAADSPPIPPEVIEKIGAITKILAPDELLNLPVSEPNCNCFHCQLIRTIGNKKQEIEIEEIVPDKELEFCQWDIQPDGEKLFSVTSRLDKNEKYSVYLGEPVGCTCGHPGCEHIVAVLKT